MFCKKCGKEIEDDSEFCVYCGTTVSVTIDKDEKDPGNSAGPAVSTEKYPMALPKGSVLAGQYIIDKPIGQGGFGITYIAEDHTNGKKVAVKEYYPETLATRQDHTMVIPLNTNRNENFRYGMDCFLQEAKTLSNFIDNEDIVRVYSYFEENNTAYFVMEYIEGVSLADYIRGKGGKISFDDACHTLFPIMDALAAVHDKGIIHRDVSPDNIFVTWEGHVKLIDFGAARYSIGDRSMSLDVILKHGFAPKEQYSRHGRQGAYTDIYALAATFYYAITGKKPQDSVDRMDKDLLISPSAAGAGIGPNAEKVLLHALAVQPDKRYQKMTDFKQEMVEAIKRDNSPDAAANNAVVDEEKTYFDDGFAPQNTGAGVNGGFSPQNIGMTGNGGFIQQDVGMSVSGGFPQQSVGTSVSGDFAPQNTGTGVNGGFSPQNVGMTGNGGFIQQDVGMSVNGGFSPQSVGTSVGGGFPPQDVGMSINGAFPQQNAGMNVNNTYPQQIPVTQMNAGIPNTGIPNTAWGDPSQAPQREKKKGNKTLIAIIAAAVTLVLVVVVGLLLWKSGSAPDPQDDPLVSNNEDPTPTKKDKPTPGDDEGDEPTPTESAQGGGNGNSGSRLDGKDDFPSEGFLYVTSYGSVYYYELVKNNTDSPTSIKANAMAYDHVGNVLGVEDDSIKMLGPGETTIIQLLFSDLDGTMIDHVDCQLIPVSVDNNPCVPFLSDIVTEETINSDNVIISCTNNNSFCVDALDLYAMFFDADGKLLEVENKMIYDLDFEVKPNTTHTIQIDTDVDYDHMEYYLAGTSRGGSPDKPEVSDNDISVKEYSILDRGDNMYYYLIFTNNSSSNTAVGINLVGYDSSGKAIAAKDGEITMLGAGETSIAEISLDHGSDIDHISYATQYKTDLGSYKAIIGKLNVDLGGVKDNVKITVENTADYTANSVRVYTLFFDAAGKLVYEDDRNFTDDNYEIKTGNSITKDVSCSVEYDQVEVYLTGYGK
ncbi:MAG: protein kinase [Lachnospiraceae bacterium]|nr:protein kinase [Lachnospiraceae bacterium]